MNSCKRSYAAWLQPFHPSVPSLIPFPHFCQIGLNRFGPDPHSSSSKSNYSSSSKHGERKQSQFFLKLRNLVPDQIGYGHRCSSTWAIESVWVWHRTAEVIHNNQHNDKGSWDEILPSER